MAEERKSLFQKATEASISTVMAALVLGFFGVLWTKSTQVDETLTSLRQASADTKKELSAANDVLTNTVAKLQLQTQDLETRIVAQENSIQGLSKSVVEKHPDLRKNLEAVQPKPQVPVTSEKAEDRANQLNSKIQQKKAAYKW